MNDRRILEKAAEVALSRKGRKSFLLCAVGRRTDGPLVCSVNEAVKFPTPSAHAEARLCKKLDLGAEVWVARVLRRGEWGLAKPCENCLRALLCRGVQRICYTTGPRSWEVIT
jgi:hypothetical protein